MSAINPELFNETYHFETSIFQNFKFPDKKVQINQEIEFTIKWNRETKKLSSDFSLEHPHYCGMIFTPLYGQNGRLPNEEIGPSKLLTIIGTDKETHKIIQIEAEADIWTITRIKSIKITDENITSISEHRDHYLYKNSKMSDVLHSSSIAIKGIDYPFTICNESINDSPQNLDCVSLVYSINNGRFPPEDIQDYHMHIIGFLFGCPLTNFGYSRYDDSGKVIETYVINPSDSKMLMSLKSQCPPIDYKDLLASQIQGIINPIIVNYCNLDLDIYHDYIKALLHRLWESHLLHLDYKFHLIVSGLEVFMNFWSHQNNVNLNPKDIIINDRFDTLLLPYITMIREVIANEDNKISKKAQDRLYTNLGELNKAKIKLPKMYDAVGLPLTPNEFEIIRLRGDMMHEKPFILDGEVPKYVNYYLDAITLCNRSLLKLLGYTGDYIDYRKEWRFEKL